jgi:hypothetical protein
VKKLSHIQEYRSVIRGGQTIKLSDETPGGEVIVLDGAVATIAKNLNRDRCNPRNNPGSYINYPERRTFDAVWVDVPQVKLDRGANFKESSVKKHGIQESVVNTISNTIEWALIENRSVSDGEQFTIFILCFSRLARKRQHQEACANDST